MGKAAPVTFASGSFLGIDTSSAPGGSLTYAGNITNSGLGINKLGTGTLVLPGANTYTGGTTVTAGTLQIAGSGSAGLRGHLCRRDRRQRHTRIQQQRDADVFQHN